MNESSHNPALVGLEEDRIAIFRDGPEAPSLVCAIELDNDLFACQSQAEMTPEVVLGHIRDGLETAMDLAEESHFNKGDLSKWSSSMIQKMTERDDDT